MNGTCGCETHERHNPLGCQECGAATCPSCWIEIGTEAYCRWCATSLVQTLSA